MSPFDQQIAKTQKSDWEQIFNYSGFGILITNARDNTIISANPTFARMHGYTVEELPGRPILDFYLPEDRDFYYSQIEAVHKKNHHSYETIHLKKDGTKLPVFVDATVHRDVQGNPLFRASYCQDISERKKIEEELRATKHRLELAQESGKVGCFEWDLVSQKYVVSPELENLYGLERGGFNNYVPEWWNIIHPEDRNKAKLTVEEAVLKGIDLENEFRVIWPDGSTHWLYSRAKIIRNEKGRPVRLLGVNVDITKQKLAEEKAKTESKKFLTLIQRSATGILLLDSDGKVISFGHPVLGYTSDDKLGENILDTIHPQDRNKVLEELQFLTQYPGATRTSEYRAMHKNGTWRWVESVSTNLLADPDIRAVVVNYRDITDRKEAERMIREQATMDSLTGFLNRKSFQDVLEGTLAEAQKNKSTFSILFLDLDRFKNVNDTLGHDVGDLVLQKCAEKLMKTVRKDGIVGRLGGDEFGILMQGIHNESDAERMAKRILLSLSEPVKVKEYSLFMGASIGITIFPRDGKQINHLLRNADIALYRAKDEGRNNYQFYNQDMNVKVSEKLLMEQRLRKAATNRELFLLYQPIIDLKNNGINSVEALMRWRHPELGIMQPNQFIPIAEETGLVRQLGRWALDEAIMQQKSWAEQNLMPPKITINVSTYEFNDNNFTKEVYTTLVKTDVEPSCLEIEITESTAMRDVDKTMGKLKDLTGMGIDITLDDFGTGYSSLSYLRQLPIQKLKIDKSFVKNCITNEQDAAIVRAIISMAHSLGLKVVAEGIEKEDQLEFIYSLDCDFAQGFLFGEPQTAGDIETFLEPKSVFENQHK